MKKISTYLSFTFFILLISCVKEPFIDFGFDSPIDENSSGLVIADISHHVQHVYLNGFVSLTRGEVEVTLSNADGVIVYAETLVAPGEWEINNAFNANSGYWKLKYVSDRGIGEIDLHLHKH